MSEDPQTPPAANADAAGLDEDALLRDAVERRFRAQLEPLQPGEVISERYRIERELGRGGMGAVYEATHLVTGKRVAVKWLFPAGSRSDEVRGRFYREAQVGGRIKHPNLVDIYDIAEHADGIYLVMELLQGESLRARLDRSTPSEQEAVSLLMPALRGVAAAHAEGVIHRDLKPDNIYLCHRGQGVLPEAKVLDFGMSKLLAGAAAAQGGMLTLDGAVLGTPHYMAPEQARGEREIDGRVDVYALGVILYEAVAGRRPFLALSPPRLLKLVTQEDPTPLRQHTPTVSKGFERAVMKALARDVDKRHSGVEELARELEPFGKVGFAPGPRMSALAGELPPVRPRDRAAGPMRVMRRAAIAAVALLTGALLWFVLSRREHAEPHVVEPAVAPAAAAEPVEARAVPPLPQAVHAPPVEPPPAAAEALEPQREHPTHRPRAERPSKRKQSAPKARQRAAVRPPRARPQFAPATEPVRVPALDEPAAPLPIAPSHEPAPVPALTY